jgi:hypothetical protein
MQAIVARADLDYTTPARRSEEGMPIGNGRMGSLVWTTPSAIHFQINRDDVFAEDCTTTSFPRTHSDYASGCAFVDIDLGDPALAGGSDSGNFHQHLSIYDGLMTLNSSGVSARILATSDHDVFAIEVDDQRATPAPITVDLRMLRFLARYLRKPFPATDPHSNVVATGAHTATSALEIRDGITPSPGTPGEGRGEGSSPASQKDPHPNPLPGYRERGQGKPRILLTQHFQEASFYDASAVAVALLGRDARADYANETTVRLIASPGKGKFTVLIASSASFDRDTDVAAIALKEIDAVASNRFDDLLASNRKWWADYWPAARAANIRHASAGCSGIPMPIFAPGGRSTGGQIRAAITTGSRRRIDSRSSILRSRCTQRCTTRAHSRRSSSGAARGSGFRKRRGSTASQRCLTSWRTRCGSCIC